MDTALPDGETVLRESSGAKWIHHGEFHPGTLILTTRRLIMETTHRPIMRRLGINGRAPVTPAKPEVFFERRLQDISKMTPRCDKDINGRISLMPNAIVFIVGDEEPVLIHLNRDIGTWIADIDNAKLPFKPAK